MYIILSLNPDTIKKKKKKIPKKDPKTEEEGGVRAYGTADYDTTIYRILL